jgi:hypothetical protein
MVAEGSVLVASAAPRGAASDVAPEGFPHPVYRAGFALSVPVPLAIAAVIPKPASAEPVSAEPVSAEPATAEPETAS